MTARIVELWLEGATPAFDGIYRSNGQAYSIEVDGPNLSWFDIGPQIDMDQVLGKPDGVMEIDACAEIKIPNGFAVCGEGALGSEGFFARLDSQRRLVWIVALLHSNPFVQARVDDDSSATFINNLGNSVTVDLGGSDFGP